MSEKARSGIPELTMAAKFGMRYNAYHFPKNDTSVGLMGYGTDLMGDQNRDKGKERAGDLEVHRASPYEFCVTAEPCIGAGFNVAQSVLVSPRVEADVSPIVAQTVTFLG